MTDERSLTTAAVSMAESNFVCTYIDYQTNEIAKSVEIAQIHIGCIWWMRQLNLISWTQDC